MRSVAYILAVTLAPAFLSACSVPTSAEVCHATCAEWQRCLNPQPLAAAAAICTANCPIQCAQMMTEAARTTCQQTCSAHCDPKTLCDSNCDAYTSKYDDVDTIDDLRCTNSKDVRQQQMSCLSDACGDVINCLSGIDNTCVLPI